MYRLISCCIFLFFVISATAQNKNTVVEKRVYNTQLTTIAPEIDGNLSDEIWKNVAWSGDFTQWQPDEGKKPTQQTKFKVLYDDKNLYIAARCYDTDPSKIVKRLARRDAFTGDWIEINIDSYLDLRTAFSFTVSVAGVKGDEFVSENGSNWDASWNPIWYAKTQIDEEGWTAELKIPFTQLRFSEKEEQVWGLQVQRRDFRLEERSIWQRVPRELSGWVSNLGELHGIKNVKPQKQIEIQPYVVAQTDSFEKEPNNPFATGNSNNLTGGVDGKIGITNNLTLDFTINPDFGQVEADPAAISLDGFQIFFEEQRPFFIENKNIFNYSFSNSADNVFYSRRIGRSPQGYPAAGVGEFVDLPNNTTILGAAKFSGKTKNGWSLGLLESVTNNMFAEIDSNGDRREELVEPLTNYLVARVQKDFNKNNSFIGAMFTSANRDLKENLSHLRDDAFTGGIDFRHNWNNRNYFLKGKLVGSYVKGSKEAITLTQRSITHLFQRVDAGHVSVDLDKTSLAGTGGEFEIGKEGGGNFRYKGGFVWRSPELELNDIGFLRQADEIRQFTNFSYFFLKPTKIYRNIRLNLNQFTSYDFDGNFNRTQYDFEGNSSWKNNWWTEVGAAHKPRIYINSFLRGGPRWRYSEENYQYVFMGSDQRKKFNFTLGYIQSKAKQNNFLFYRYVLRLNYQPMDALSISLNSEFETNPNKTQYVSKQTFGTVDRYILGKIDNQTWSTSLRLNYSLNPNLSIQYYGQPFISRGRYTNFNIVNNPTAENLNKRVTWFTENQISKNGSGYSIDEDRNGSVDYQFSNPDFSFVQFRSNLVLRWEYIPGSELYFVWSQGLTGYADTKDSLANSLETELFKKRPENTFLLKATYRFML